MDHGSHLRESGGVVAVGLLHLQSDACDGCSLCNLPPPPAFIDQSCMVNVAVRGAISLCDKACASGRYVLEVHLVAVSRRLCCPVGEIVALAVYIHYEIMRTMLAIQGTLPAVYEDGKSASVLPISIQGQANGCGVGA